MSFSNIQQYLYDLASQSGVAVQNGDNPSERQFAQRNPNLRSDPPQWRKRQETYEQLYANRQPKNLTEAAIDLGFVDVTENATEIYLRKDLKLNSIARVYKAPQWMKEGFGAAMNANACGQITAKDMCDHLLHGEKKTVCLVVGGAIRDTVQLAADKCQQVTAQQITDKLKDIDFVINRNPDFISEKLSDDKVIKGHMLKDVKKHDKWVTDTWGVQTCITANDKEGLDMVAMRQGTVRVEQFTFNPSFRENDKPAVLDSDIADRDFVVNTLMYDPVGNFLIDPTGCGVHDAVNKHLRMIVGSPGHMDAWHFIRCIKFMARGYSVDENSRTRLVCGFEEEYGKAVYNATEDDDYKLSLLAGSLARICKATVDGPTKVVELKALIDKWYEEVFLANMEALYSGSDSGERSRIPCGTLTLYGENRKVALCEVLVLARYRKFPEHHSYTAAIIHTAELMDNLLGQKYNVFPSEMQGDWRVTNFCLNVYFRQVSHFPGDWVQLTNSLRKYLDDLNGTQPSLPTFCRQQRDALYARLDFTNYPNVDNEVKYKLKNCRILQSSLMRHICDYIAKQQVGHRVTRLDRLLKDYEWVRAHIKNQKRWAALIALLGFQARDKLDELVMFGGEVRDFEAENDDESVKLNLDLFNSIQQSGALLDSQLQAIALDPDTGRLKVKVYNMEKYIPVRTLMNFVDQLPGE